MPALDGAEVHACMARLLDSDLFRKARRLRRLLQFLVEKRLRGSVNETTEYGIGIAVFDRDPATYRTGDDPIVRVQVGRLRTKLKLYYAIPAHADDVVISIPTGSYLPVIQRIDASLGRGPVPHLLAFRQLGSAGGDAASSAFAQGLSEELRHQLFQALGDRVVSLASRQDAGEQAPPARHVLEGSVRIDGDLTRTAMRLVDAVTGAIVWSEQRDQYGRHGILLQEELAQAICRALIAQLPPGSVTQNGSAG
jgi:TolB-like protein